jgi:hypothetical protein
MNNREVAHLWANQSRESGKGSNMFFTGPTLYSYGLHFPIASIVKCPNTGQPIALFNRARYSVSTGKHQGYARSAASHITRYSVRQCDVTTTPRNADHLAEMVEAARIEGIAEDDDKRAEARERAKRKRAEKKRTADAMAAFPEELAAWRLGGPAPRAGFITGTALRLSLARPGMVETSRSAFIPVTVARKAWPILAEAVKAEEASPSSAAWVPFFERKDFNWGDYKGLALRRVARGEPVQLQVGCHSIHWRELESLAVTLGFNRE